jgi:hypothetical protein
MVRCRAAPRSAVFYSSARIGHTSLLATRVNLGGKLAQFFSDLGGLFSNSDLGDTIGLLAELQSNLKWPVFHGLGNAYCLKQHLPLPHVYR